MRSCRHSAVVYVPACVTNTSLHRITCQPTCFRTRLPTTHQLSSFRLFPKTALWNALPRAFLWHHSWNSLKICFDFNKHSSTHLVSLFSMVTWSVRGISWYASDFTRILSPILRIYRKCLFAVLLVAQQFLFCGLFLWPISYTHQFMNHDALYDST